MPLDRCLFALQVVHPALRDEAEARARALERFYAPLGARAAWRWVEAARTLVGGIGFGGAELDPARPLVFGEEPAAGLDPASDADLRSMSGMGALIEPGERTVTAVSWACPPTSLYSARGERAAAWSTHAVAAGWLARGSIRVDAAAIPELLAAEFVGGERTHIEGVTAVPPATVVELGERGASERCFWPLRERWALVPAADAQEHGERELLAALAQRLSAVKRPFCALTAGLDSGVAALALEELGVAFHAYTWGEAGASDVLGGAELAEVLGVRHHFQPFEWFGDEEALRFVDADVRGTEGLVHVGFGRPTWPEAMSAFVTGAGGETGRCFYYRDRLGAGSAAEPDRRELAPIMLASMEGRIAGAHAAAREHLRERVDEWLGAAEAAGHRGWHSLDVLYAEQRVRRWLRGMLPHIEPTMVPAFAPPEVARALISLPVAERAADAFHRRFIAARRPALEPPPAPPVRQPRRALPPAVRRLAARVPGIGRLRGGQPSELAGQWDERPQFRDWVADGVLGSALIEEALGARWAARTRARFLDADADAETVALWAGGPVALASALRDLA